jgi:DNA polymerase-1
MDRRAIPFVDRMQEVGMRVDRELLRALEADLEVGREKALTKVQRVAGDRWFNPGSGDQVADWLYSYRGFQPLEFTKKGRGSTSDGALQMLRGYHGDDAELVEFIDGVQDYREADKYLGTFIEPIWLTMKRDKRGNWRVHPNFRITRVVSGRLSSFDPNVLAFPTRTALGKRIRACFVAEDGYVIISVDLSQIELRTGAHFSQDRTMCQAFRDGRDLHALTGSVIFKCLLDLVSETQRYVAKTINFATFYGISARALLEQLFKAGIFDYSLKDCERFIADWFGLYSGVRPWQHRLWKKAEADGFVRTMFGRICYVPNLRVNDSQLREAAQRLAGNMPIQGTASDLVKRAEIRLHDHLESTGLREQAWPWLQMHDELVLEAKKRIADQLARDVERFMLADQDLISVPLKAKAGIGVSWASAK